MNTRLSIGIVVTTVLILALGTVGANQPAIASSFPGENGKGHTETCSAGNSDNTKDGPCPGNSGGKGSTETTNAGKSHVVKDKDCRQGGDSC